MHDVHKDSIISQRKKKKVKKQSHIHSQGDEHSHQHLDEHNHDHENGHDHSTHHGHKHDHDDSAY